MWLALGGALNTRSGGQPCLKEIVASLEIEGWVWPRHAQAEHGIHT